MGGSWKSLNIIVGDQSAPRVHGWFHYSSPAGHQPPVCPACAWVVPTACWCSSLSQSLPRVCMGGSDIGRVGDNARTSAPRVHGWFRHHLRVGPRLRVCPACAWVVPSRTIIRAVSRLSFDIRSSPPSRYKPLTRLNNRNVRRGGIAAGVFMVYSG